MERHLQERPNFSVLYNGAKPCMHRSKCQQISVWCLQTSDSACCVITRSAMPGVLHSKPLVTPVRCFASSARCSRNCGQLRSSCRPQPALQPVQRRSVCSTVVQATAAPAAADTERCVRSAPVRCCKARPSTCSTIKVCCVQENGDEASQHRPDRPGSHGTGACDVEGGAALLMCLVLGLFTQSVTALCLLRRTWP